MLNPTGDTEMLRSKLFLPVAIALAVGGPFVVANPELRDKVRQSWTNMTNKVATDEVELDVSSHTPDPSKPEDSINQHVNTPSTSLLFTPTVADFRDVFRFDITPNWVKSRWPRVSACVTEDGMDGFRVPLVTGTDVTDLHGSLTYFFDGTHRVQRIEFYGFTGDVSRLVNVMTNHFGLKAQETSAAGLYTRDYHGRPVSALRVLNASVVRADQPNQQLQVMIELNGTQGRYQMSERFRRILETDRMAGRW